MNIPNHITLEALKHMPVGEIAALPAAELARLQQETTKALRSAKMACDWLDGALALKYADQADDLRRSAQKDTGTVRFADGEITVKADLPKRVVWDQGKLAEMAERIRAAGDDPAESSISATRLPSANLRPGLHQCRRRFAMPARSIPAS